MPVLYPIGNFGTTSTEWSAHPSGTIAAAIDDNPTSPNLTDYCDSPGLGSSGLDVRTLGLVTTAFTGLPTTVQVRFVHSKSGGSPAAGPTLTSVMLYDAAFAPIASWTGSDALTTTPTLVAKDLTVIPGTYDYSGIRLGLVYNYTGTTISYAEVYALDVLIDGGDPTPADTGTGSESALTTTAAINAADTGHGTESATAFDTLNQDGGVGESSTGVSTATVEAFISPSDSGHGTESIDIEIRFDWFITQYASAVECVCVNAANDLTDDPATGDDASVIVGAIGTDTISSVEEFDTTNDQARTDAGSSADRSIIGGSQADAGAATESPMLNAYFADASTDTGATDDSPSVSADIGASDSAAGTDSTDLIADLSFDESAIAIDAYLSLFLATLDDDGLGVDAATSTADHTVADLGSIADYMP